MTAGRVHVAAVAAVLSSVAVPWDRAAAQTFYGCSTQATCELLQFTMSLTPNERGNFFAILTQALTAREAPINWFGAELTYSGGTPRFGAGPDDLDSPFSTFFLPINAPGSRMETQSAFFNAPSAVTSATLVIDEHPPEAPPGVFVRRRVALTEIAPFTVLPEPATMALVGGGLAIVGVIAQRRTRDRRRAG